MPEAVKARPRSLNSFDEALASVASGPWRAVEKPVGWAVGDNNVGPGLDGPLVTVWRTPRWRGNVLETSAGVLRRRVGTRKDGQLGAVGELHSVGALI